MKVAVVGATGLVGSTMLRILEERDFPVTELIPVASERSVGMKVSYKGKEWSVVSADTAIAMKPALALFSAGGGTSTICWRLFWRRRFRNSHYSLSCGAKYTNKCN